MSISINNNLQTQRCTPAKKGGKATSGFCLPVIKDTSAPDESTPQVSNKTGIEDSGIISSHLLANVKTLPEYILNRTIEDVQKMIGAAPILVQFNEDGSAQIRDGLSPEDYLRAKKFLEEIEAMRRRGGTISSYK
jgi:hypothetical protein